MTVELRSPLAAQTSLMRAVRLTGPGALEVRYVPRPQPGAGEVRVRLEGCGVCASNLGPWAGPDWMEFPTAPGALGHEGWGRIDAVGEGVRDLRLGQRVVTLFQNSYADYDVGPQDQVIPLPEDLDGQAFPGEPLGCAMNIFRRSGIEAGQWVAIVGVGFLGALLIQLAKVAGANVIGISRRPFAREVARECGADMVLSDDAEAEVVRITESRLCERVIEATGKQAPLDLAGRLVGVRGRLVIAGYHQDGPRTVDMQQWNWRGIDVINAHERDPAEYRRGVVDAIAAVQQGRLRPRRLLTHVLPLEALGEALDLTRDRPEGFLKAWVAM